MDSFYRCIRTHVPTAAVNKVSLAVFCGRRKDDSLNYNVFGNEVKQEVEKLLGTEVRVELRQITKNNGIILDGICILEKGCNVSPTIYLEEFYREYKNGMSLREIASRICEVYEKRCRGIPFSLEYFLDFEKMKERIFCKLINWELNKELLNEVPNIPCLDLAVVFVCAVENEEFGNGSILVREEHRKLWRVSKELLYEYARENTFRLRPFELKSMEELIEDMVEPKEKKLLKEIPMYVLSNQKRVFGAAGLLYDRVLSDAGVRLEDDFYAVSYTHLSDRKKFFWFMAVASTGRSRTISAWCTFRGGENLRRPWKSWSIS